MRLTRNLNFNRIELLDVIRKNKEKHIKEYEVALSQYHKELIEDLEDKLDKAKRGVSFNPRVTLPEPEHHRDDYTRAIKMFEMATEKEIELDQQTFCQLVMDEWAWKASFNSNTVSYAAKAAFN